MALDQMTGRICVKKSVLEVFLLLWIVVSDLNCVLGHLDSHYTNKWAVSVPEGKETAHRIAREHGFRNEGQIGSLDGYFLFSHEHVSKRSADPSHHYHARLERDQRVSWTEQQINKIRKKRDFLQPSPDDVSKESVDMNFIDPLWKDQWYLNKGALGGYDMNVLPVWKKGITGRGVVVSILDDGIERNHTDLVDNYSPEASWDINGEDADPMPRYDTYDENRHGTRCAGEVAAQANNSKCSVGIAYNARVGGVRMLDGGVSDYVEAKALSLNPQVIDIYSASWGPDDNGKVVDGPASLAKQAFINGVLKGRGGKGSIFVWASGNGGSQFDSCNCDGYTNSIFTLSISSVSEQGRRPWYLEECSSTLATTYSSGENFNDKKIVTTDLHDRCTSAHTGTSASAPLAAGICALALEANPGLTWRDMQYIVLMTSRPDPLMDGEWTVNGVGRKVSHRYGYGVMDGDGMVTLAQKWRTVPHQHICTSDTVVLNQPIGPDGVVVTIKSDGCQGQSNQVRYLEHVQAKVSLQYSRRGDVKLTLISPNGTRSLMLAERKKDTEEGEFLDWPFMSVHFWGESPVGQWKLEVSNAGERNNHGMFIKWQMILYGVEIYPVRLKKPGDDYDEQGADIFGDNISGDFHDVLNGNTDQHVTNYINVDGNKQIYIDDDDINNELNDNNWSIDDKGKGLYINSQPDLLEIDEGNPAEHGWYDWFHGITQNGGQGHCHEQCALDSDCSGPHPEDCETCRNYRIGTSGPCVSECPEGSYVDILSGRCLLCTPPCEMCLHLSTSSCLTCMSGYYLLEDEARCVESCPVGTYYGDGAVCVSCSELCLTCTMDECLECIPGYSMQDGRCSLPCTEAFYQTDQQICEPCHMSCSDCYGPSSYQCLSCTGSYVFQNDSCLTGCSQGFYLNDQQDQCLRCSLGCAECTSDSLCLECLGSLLLQNDQCINSCSRGEYFDDVECVPCHQSCDTCIGSGHAECLSCPDDRYLVGGECVTSCPSGYYMPTGDDYQAVTCLECPPSCQECSGPGSDECTGCNTGTHLIHGECRPLCTQSQYYSTGSCHSCHGSCLRCHGAGSLGCSACPVGRYLSPSGGCIEICPLMYYSSESNVCTKCSPSCERCSGPLKCTLCVGGFMLVGGICLSPTPEHSNCLHGQYLDPVTKECAQCDTHCETCTGPGAKQCLTCVAPYHLQHDLKRCVLCCTDRHRHGCCNCHPTTGVCMEDRNIDDPYDVFMVTSGSSDVSLTRSQITLSNLGDFASTRRGFVAVVIFFCLFSVIVFFVIFGVLQARNRGRTCWPNGQRYHAVPTYPKHNDRVVLTTEDFLDEDECFTA